MIASFLYNKSKSSLSWISTFRNVLFLLACLGDSIPAFSQSAIAWQKSIGTEFIDNALKLFPDEAGNLIVMGKEPHEDFTGNIREYMVITKINPDGLEIWKTYHDVALETFSLPVEYYFGDHFYTEEFGDTLLNLVVSIYDRILQYKILDRTGQYYFYEEISSQVLDVNRENEKVYAKVLCSLQQSCYGPDSLVVEKFDPSPDSVIFNPIEWTFELKQNFRTAPIQGHYDFSVQDIRMQDDGQVYLLVMIQRWDFQFCTDCADAFIDAWCEVFKFDAEGNFMEHINLKTAKAVVSHMQFVEGGDGSLLVRIDDINASGTKVITSLYRLDENLNLLKKFDMDNLYHFIQADSELNYYTTTNINNAADPEIHGLTDILVSKFDLNGELLWKSYYGGSSWDFIKGLTLSGDDGILFLANTESKDFDIEENIGGQDMWLVKLTEDGTTGTTPDDPSLVISVYPNPCTDFLYLNAAEPMQVLIYDLQGREVLRQNVVGPGRSMDVRAFPSGVYGLHATDSDGKRYTGKWIKV